MRVLREVSWETDVWWGGVSEVVAVFTVEDIDKTLGHVTPPDMIHLSQFGISNKTLVILSPVSSSSQ